MISSMGGRAVGVLGTLVITRFLTPDIIGEVILCMTASWLTTWGFGQYTVVKGRGADLGLRAAGLHHPALYLVLEIVIGAIAYVGAALVLCRETSRDLLGLLTKALRKS